jgi:Aerotolerance regulator N-terminal
MIGWQNPTAFWALPLAGVPVIIHLLRTHHARRVAFPSIRFVPASRTAAVRMRLPTDVVLMLLRVGIVVLAIGAVAGPILLTDARIQAWNARTVRAVVVDVSESMRAPDGGGRAPEQPAAEVAQAELDTAASSRRFEVRRRHEMEEVLTRASRWLAASPPARREIVVISDFHRGVWQPADADSVPHSVGLRLIPVGRTRGREVFEGARLFGGGAVPARAQAVEVSNDATAVAVERRQESGSAGLRVAFQGAEASIERLLQAVAAAGAPAGSTDEPIAIWFSNGEPPATGLTMVRPGWMLRTVLRLREDPTLTPSPPSPGRDAKPSDPWTTVARSPDGAPLVRAAAAGRELLLEIAAPPDSLLAAATVRAALTARLDVDVYAEREVVRLEETSLMAFTRPSAGVSRDEWRSAESTDARWFWLLALVLLALEQWLRDRSLRGSHRGSDQEVARAA